jgi:hypothetical protein
MTTGNIMTQHKWSLSDEELDAQIQKAKTAWIESENTEQQAKKAEYNHQRNLIFIELTNGIEINIPPILIEGLSEAKPQDLENLHLSDYGRSIHWESLDVDLDIPGIVSGILGTKAWMSQLGKKGGEKTSLTKAAAARENGKKGGRPRKKLINT